MGHWPSRGRRHLVPLSTMPCSRLANHFTQAKGALSHSEPWSPKSAFAGCARSAWKKKGSETVGCLWWQNNETNPVPCACDMVGLGIAITAFMILAMATMILTGVVVVLRPVPAFSLPQSLLQDRKPGHCSRTPLFPGAYAKCRLL